MATVHSQERPFKCDFCNHSSGRKDKIREHVQSVHLKTRPPRPKKKYPKKPKAQITSSITNSSSSAVSTEIVNLPQHPLPRHELHTGWYLFLIDDSERIQLFFPSQIPQLFLVKQPYFDAVPYLCWYLKFNQYFIQLLNLARVRM